MPECRVCKEYKEQGDFPKNASYSSGYATLCKSCNSFSTKKFREKNPFYLQARTYRITQEQVEQMYKESVGCEICGKQDQRRLVIDHDHGTGKIRGLLCDLCNKGIGLLRDDKAVVQKAYNYLDKHG